MYVYTHNVRCVIKGRSLVSEHTYYYIVIVHNKLYNFNRSRPTFWCFIIDSDNLRYRFEPFPTCNTGVCWNYAVYGGFLQNQAVLKCWKKCRLGLLQKLAILKYHIVLNAYIDSYAWYFYEAIFSKKKGEY